MGTRPRPPKTVLDPARVRKILDRLERGDSQAQVARDEGVHRSTVHFILAGYTWLDVWAEWDGGRERLLARRGW